MVKYSIHFFTSIEDKHVSNIRYGQFYLNALSLCVFYVTYSFQLCWRCHEAVAPFSIHLATSIRFKVHNTQHWHSLFLLLLTRAY